MPSVYFILPVYLDLVTLFSVMWFFVFSAPPQRKPNPLNLPAWVLHKSYQNWIHDNQLSLEVCKALLRTCRDGSTWEQLALRVYTRFFVFSAPPQRKPNPLNLPAWVLHKSYQNWIHDNQLSLEVCKALLRTCRDGSTWEQLALRVYTQ